MTKRSQNKEWPVSLFGVSGDTLFLYEFLNLDATPRAFASWLEELTRETLRQATLRKANHARLAEEAAGDYVAYQERLGATTHVFHLSVAIMDEPKQTASVSIEIAPPQTSGIRVTLHTMARTAHETFFFFYLRDEILKRFDEPSNEKTSPKMGRPSLADDAQQQRIVKDWLKAKANRVKKKVFAGSVVVPGQVGIPVRTLTRWERKWEPLLMPFLAEEE